MKTSKLRITDLCVVNSSVTCEFPDDLEAVGATASTFTGFIRFQNRKGWSYDEVHRQLFKNR